MTRHFYLLFLFCLLNSFHPIKVVIGHPSWFNNITILLFFLPFLSPPSLPPPLIYLPLFFPSLSLPPSFLLFPSFSSLIPSLYPSFSSLPLIYQCLIFFPQFQCLPYYFFIPSLPLPSSQPQYFSSFPLSLLFPSFLSLLYSTSIRVLTPFHFSLFFLSLPS